MATRTPETRSWRYYWGAWVAMGLFMATMDLPYLAWWQAVLVNQIQYLAWGGLGLCVLKLLRRRPLAGAMPLGRRIRNWLLHLVASAAATCTVLFVTLVALRALEGWPLAGFFPSFRSYLLSFFHYTLFTYWAVVGVHEALELQRQGKDRDLRASQLETRLREAQLQALRMQLQPHFLFNTLNAVTALIRHDPPAAEAMLVRLGDLLRLTLEDSGGLVVDLGRELALLQKYLEIQEIRFKGRLAWRIDLDPPSLRTAQVPALIFQPLVENALKHGLSGLVGGGQITIRATAQGGQLCLEVEDDGVGLGTGPFREGVGLANTRATLESLYGSHQRFELLPRPQGGALARAFLPLAVPEAL